ncbi:MAG: hypothetical protein LBS69_08410, partial [Prevotellaceae bacterium]|nr:hypothetical protein [Prevotellaceae bacterium]
FVIATFTFLFPHNLAAQTKDIAITLTAQIDSLVKNTKPDYLEYLTVPEFRQAAIEWVKR